MPGMATRLKRLPDPHHDSPDADAAEMNDPNITHLSPDPSLGGRRRVDASAQADALYNGEPAPEEGGGFGRSSSPKLFAQAASHPTCHQLRAFKWENGIAVSLGVIDAEACEEDFVRQFYSAMPKRGEGRAQFKFQPINIQGRNIGVEFQLVISEHHEAIRLIRETAESEREALASGRTLVPESDNGNARLMEHILATQEARAQNLEDALESERERLRDDEMARAQERIDLASRAAEGVQAITERMMADEARRAERAQAQAQEQGQILVTTLTSIFSQQQAAANALSAEAARRDELRLEQERQRAERERNDADARLKRERDDADHKRKMEREEMELRLRLEREAAERKMAEVKLEVEAKLTREREDAERRDRREREERESRDRREKEERESKERWFVEERSRREAREATESREREAERQRQHDRALKELESAAQRDREHQERMMKLSTIESEAKHRAETGDVLGGATKLLGQLGISLPDLLRPQAPEVDEGPAEPSPWVAVIPVALAALAEFAKMATARSQAQAAQAPLLPPGPGPIIQPIQTRLPSPGVPVQPVVPTQPQAQPIREGGDPTPVAAQAPAAPPVNPEPHAPGLSEVAAAKGLKLPTLRNARVALRNLVRNLSNASEDKWETITTQAISNEMAIYHYVKAVSVLSALREAGADDALSTRVIHMMRNSPAVAAIGTDIPYEVTP